MGKIGLRQADTPQASDLIALERPMYRDNGVANNLAGKVALLYVDWHYEIDALGSMAEYVKWT